MRLKSCRLTTKVVILMGAIAGCVLVGGIFTYVMCSSQLKSANVQLQERQQQEQESSQIAKKLDSVESTYLDTQSELSFLETSVSNYEYIPTMLKQLEVLGKSLDMKVISVRPQAVQAAAPVSPPPSDSSSASGTSGQAPAATQAKKKPYQELSIEVTLEGNYWQARNFLYRLTKFPKIVSVKSIQIAPADASGTTGGSTLQVCLSVTAFVFNADESKSASTDQATSAAAPVDRRPSNEG